MTGPPDDGIIRIWFCNCIAPHEAHVAVVGCCSIDVTVTGCVNELLPIDRMPCGCIVVE